jgi:hypothetical protein
VEHTPADSGTVGQFLYSVVSVVYSL